MPSAGAGTSPWLHDCSWQAGAHSMKIFIHISSFHLTNSLSTPSHYIYIFLKKSNTYIFSFYPLICFTSQYRKWACCHWSFTKTLLKLILTRLGFLKAGAVWPQTLFCVPYTPLAVTRRQMALLSTVSDSSKSFSQAPTVWKSHSRISSGPCPKWIWEWPEFPSYSAQCVHPVGLQAKSARVSAEDTKVFGKLNI